MRQRLLSLGIGCALALGMGTSAIAVDPASVQENANVAWSKVVTDPFDGKIVYDKHYTTSDKEGFVFVSSWSQGGIRATYERYRQEIVGYRTVWRTREVKRTTKDGKERVVQETYPEQEPVYQRFSDRAAPQAILLSIRGQVYRYESGPVTPELAQALVSAPNETMKIRLVWQNGATLDVPIGKGTVAAWKSVFRDAVSAAPAVVETR